MLPIIAICLFWSISVICICLMRKLLEIDDKTDFFAWIIYVCYVVVISVLISVLIFVRYYL